jgi:hypothetical protein
MPRTRRFALVAVLALAGGLVLAGCGRSQPSAAAYVGGTRYSERQVDAIAEQIRASPIADQLASPRVSALQWLVLGDLARKAAAERSIAVPPSDYNGLGQQMGVSPGSQMVHAYADWVAVRTVIAQRADPVAPSEEDLREVFDTLRREPDFPPNVTFEQAAEQLRADEDLPLLVGVRNVLRDVANKHKVVVNPRYRPLVVDLGSLHLVLAEGSGLVTDLPSR